MTQVKNHTFPPAFDSTLKAEVTFCGQGVISPLLSNLMLDVLDKELERRGHRFVRYADDRNIHVRSRRAGERVMASVTRFLARRLKLKVNTDKSAVDRSAARTFPGFGFTAGRSPKRRIAPQALARFKARVREMTRCIRGVSLTRLVAELSRHLVGWRGCFGFRETPSALLRLDQRVRRAARHRLAAVEARAHPLRGVAPPWRQRASGGENRRQCLWAMADRQHSPALSYALPNTFFERLGLASRRCRSAAQVRRTAV